MESTIRYVGLDVHKDTIAIAVADEGRTEPDVLATIPHRWEVVRRYLKRVGRAETLLCCYEAGLGTGLRYVAQIEPDDFYRWVLPRLYAAWAERYEAISSTHGFTVSTAEVEKIRDEADFLRVVERALERESRREER